MRIIPEHKVTFVCDNDETLNIAETINPAVRYESGDIIKVVDPAAENNKNIYVEVKVLRVEHELHTMFLTEQHTVVYVERISD